MNFGRSWLRTLTALLIALGMVSGYVNPVFAATTAYDVSLVSINAPRLLAPGQSGQVVVTVKNIGSATWTDKGSHYFSLYHWNPVTKIEMKSVLDSGTWFSRTQPSALPASTVKPGQYATFIFNIKAPNTAGAYHADFIMCAENLAWIKNSKFSLDVEVRPQTAQAVTPTTVSAPSATTPTTSGDGAWSAVLTSTLGKEYQINAGDHAQVVLTFKNTGTQTWVREGKSFVSVYAAQGNKERTSPFKDFSWKSDSLGASLVETQVKPGETGTFRLELRAPSTPGMYSETFAVAAEDTDWIKGSEITFPIRVPMYDTFVSSGATNLVSADSHPTTVATTNGTYQAMLLLRSTKTVTLSGNGRQELTFGFKNTGSAAWNSYGMKVTGVKAASTAIKSPTVRDDSWIDALQPVAVQGQTNPGEVAFLKFKIKAPVKKGSYTASFKLNADNKPVDGGEVDIPITVTADGYIEPEPVVKTPATTVTTPSTPSASASTFPVINAVPLNGDESSLPAEPMIRVGLYKTQDDQMVVRAKYAALTVSRNGTSVCSLNIGESVTVHYDRTQKVYSVAGGSCSDSSANYYVIRANDGLSPMEMADISRPVSWLPGANDNTFRAQLELRFTPATNNVWVINELPFEYYLKGIAETSNSSPQEYQRALLTAARTYAMYHIQHASKHASEYYIVDATYDQVYRGYGAEARDPNVVTAVDATRGQIVTYQGKLAITPYYSRSDGRTRSWTEVWGGGPYAWLVSVPVPWDQGKTLWGHGVGMSATGALGMAADGKRYDEILKHFYQQTELRKAYR